MQSPRRPWRRRVLDRVVSGVDRVVPARGHVVLHSSPDLDDSTVALLRGLPPEIDAIVLAEDAGPARRRALQLGLSVRVVPRRSRAGLVCYAGSSVAITTHGLFGARPRPRGKQVVGLWHGEFGKLIGAFVGEAPRHFDWVPVSSSLSRGARSAEFALDPSRVHVVGSPRQALIRSEIDVSARLRVTGPVVVYAPTYRTPVRGMVRTDGDESAVAREAPWNSAALVEVLERHDATLWVRPHPAAVQEVPAGGGRLRLARNEDLEEVGLTFYELLAATDCFVTDYSSIWVDFLLRDRPQVAFCPDLETYRATRGLALEPHEDWFPGPVVVTAGELAAALDVRLAGEDPDRDARLRTARILHEAGIGDPVAAVWEHVRRVVATKRSVDRSG